MRLEVLPERIDELLIELEKWSNRNRCSIKELQSLIGKLQFICNVVRPGRLFLTRMLDCLRGNHNKTTIWINDQFQLDINWWKNYLPKFNGTGILWMYHIKTPDSIIASDACLVGMGAVCGKEYFKAEFPEKWQSANIAHLEILAVTAMCKTWANRLNGLSIIIKCDNEAVCSVLNTGRAKDKTLLQLMHEMVWTAVCHKFEFKAVHVRSKNNILPDILSRWHEGERVRRKFKELTYGKGYCEIQPAQNVFTLLHKW